MPFKLNFLSFFGFPLLIALGIYLALDSPSTNMSYTSSVYASDFSSIQFFSLELVADFNNKIMIASISFEIQIQVKDFRYLYFDMNGQNIISITMENNLKKSFILKKDTDFSIKEITNDENAKLDKGEELKIKIPYGFFDNYSNNNISIYNSTFTITINYTTSQNRNGRGINWLEPSQTFSQVYPFFYTMCRPVKCRALAPLQDSLDLNSPFKARIIVPSPLDVEVAAYNKTIIRNYDINGIITNKTNINNGLNYESWNAYEFSQDFATTSFMLNIAIGVFEEMDLYQGKYYLVTEKGFMQNCSSSLNKFNASLKYISELIKIEMPFSYLKFLVLPMAYMESFSLGPNVMFVSYSNIINEYEATLTLTQLVLHSYFGVYKKPGDWSEYYIVAGYAKYFTLKVLEKIDQSWANLTKNATLAELDELITILCDKMELCILSELQPNIYGTNILHIDNLVIPETKGCAFFSFLEQKLDKLKNNKTGEENFLNFSNSILQDPNKNSIKSIDDNQNQSYMDWFVEFIIIIQSKKDSIEVRKTIHWINWWNYRRWDGMVKPSNTPSSYIEKANDLAIAYLTSNNASNINENTINNFYNLFGQSTFFFLKQISESSLCNETIVRSLEKNYNLSMINDCDIKTSIIQMKLTFYSNSTANEKDIKDNFNNLVKSCGKLSYIEAIFDNINTNKWPNIFSEIYSFNKKFFHPYFVESFEKTNGKMINNQRILENPIVSTKQKINIVKERFLPK